MKALISKVEPRANGYRVAQVVQDHEVFEVHQDLFWRDCDETVRADTHWYDPITGELIPFSPE